MGQDDAYKVYTLHLLQHAEVIPPGDGFPPSLVRRVIGLGRVGFVVLCAAIAVPIIMAH